MPKASNRRSRHVADDILAKAAQLFDEQGYGQVSLQDIADAVGIARPSLYHYFESKEDILASLVQSATKIREEILDSIEAKKGSPLGRLRSLIRKIGESTRTNPTGLRLTLSNHGALPPEVRRGSTRSRRRLFDLLVEILTEGIALGVLRPMDETEVAATIIAALTGLQYRNIGGVNMTSPSATEQLADMLIQGISQPVERRASNIEQALEFIHRDLQVAEWHVRHVHEADTNDGPYTPRPQVLESRE